jgi:drug/metabolite transporter (DMT)-like permease
MFIGEILALIIYYSISLKTKVSLGISIESEKPFPFLWGLLPAALDCIHSGLSNLGFLLVTASVYQLMRGGVMIFNAVFQYMIFKRKIQRHQTIGIFIMLIAVGMIGMSTYLYKNANSMKSSSTLGFLIMLVSQVFRSLYYLSEEYLFIKFNALSLYRQIHLL